MLIGVTVLKIMGMRPLPETPLKGPYLAVDAERLARLFDVPFRFHGLKGGNSLAAMRAFLWLKSRDPALAKRFAQRITFRHGLKHVLKLEHDTRHSLSKDVVKLSSEPVALVSCCRGLGLAYSELLRMSDPDQARKLQDHGNVTLGVRSRRT